MLIWKPRSIEEIMSGNNVCSIKPIFFCQEKWFSGGNVGLSETEERYSENDAEHKLAVVLMMVWVLVSYQNLYVEIITSSWWC